MAPRLLLKIVAALFVSLPFAAPAQEPTATIGAYGAYAPATYLGTNRGVEYHLDLWPDQAFHLVATPADGSGTDAHAGRWYADGETGSLVLDLGGEEMQLQVRNAERLRQVGAAEDGGADLVSDGTLAPAEISLPMSGMFTYYADAATIRSCTTGRTYPVAQEGAYQALESAYTEDRAAPAEPLFVTLDASIAKRAQMEGEPRQTVTVTDFGRTWPGEDCARAADRPGLTGVYWRFDTLGDSDLSDRESNREPFLVLRDGEGEFTASIGCNTKFGGFTASDTVLSMPQVASTMMACPGDKLAALDNQLDQMLTSVARYEIGGRTLLLMDEAGQIVARLEAVYLR